MDKAVYFILIFYGIFSQGICNISEENNKNTTDLLIRQKRIVGGISRPIEASPYLVNVLENGNYNCPATLLTADVAISSAACFLNQNPQNMRITSRSRAGAQLHEIVEVIFLDPNYHSDDRTVKNLALIKFAQPIRFQTSFNRPITIFSGNLAADHSSALVVSWGRPQIVGARRIPSEYLRSLSALIISIEYCQGVYPNTIHLWNICAVATVPGDYCDNRDSGAPLIVNNQLLGIFVHRGRSHASNPNIFMNLLDHGIRRWIHQHVPSLRLF